MTKTKPQPKRKTVAHRPLLQDNPQCQHLHLAQHIDPKPGQYEVGCIDCNREGHHGDWVHLRLCLTDGQVRCCDSSPRQHASKHARAHLATDPLIRSIEPGETWVYCFAEDVQALGDIHQPKLG